MKKVTIVSITKHPNRIEVTIDREHYVYYFKGEVAIDQLEKNLYSEHRHNLSGMKAFSKWLNYWDPIRSFRIVTGIEKPVPTRKLYRAIAKLKLTKLLKYDGIQAGFGTIKDTFQLTYLGTPRTTINIPVDINKVDELSAAIKEHLEESHILIGELEKLDKFILAEKIRILLANKIGAVFQRIWYHGTTPSRWKKIQEQKYLKPYLSDDYSFGKAIWFTSDIDNAGEFGKVTLSITDENLKKFKYKKISPYPHGFIKQYRIKFDKDRPRNYDVVVSEKISLKYIKKIINPMDSKTLGGTKMAGIEGFFKIRIYGINMDTEKETKIEFEKDLQDKISGSLEDALENIIMKSTSPIAKLLDSKIGDENEVEYEVEFVKSKK